MKKLLEEWKRFLREEKKVKIFSTQTRIGIKKPEGAAAVIEDTLALIRGIPSITVVNSDTDQIASTANKAMVEIEFKFIPRSASIAQDLKAIKLDILKVSSLVLTVSPVRRMLSSLKRVQ